MFMASQEALVEAILKAMELGYQHVIFFLLITERCSVSSDDV